MEAQKLQSWLDIQLFKTTPMAQPKKKTKLWYTKLREGNPVSTQGQNPPPNTLNCQGSRSVKTKFWKGLGIPI